MTAAIVANVILQQAEPASLTTTKDESALLLRKKEKARIRQSLDFSNIARGKTCPLTLVLVQ